MSRELSVEEINESLAYFENENSCDRIRLKHFEKIEAIHKLALRAKAAEQRAGEDIRKAVEAGFATAIRYLCAGIPRQDGMPRNFEIRAEDYEGMILETLEALTKSTPALGEGG